MIDLRTQEEVALAPSALGELLGARRRHIPVINGTAFNTLAPELSAVYRYMVHERGTTITAAISRLCAAGALPGLVHCSAGKDRTACWWR